MLWLIISKDIALAINIFVSILVVACPCSLGLATPLAIVIASGNASRKGILVKTSEALENFHKAKTICFDKTGTLTKGQFTIDKVEVYGQLTKEQVLEYAVLGESYSNHPIAKSIIKKSNMEKYIAEHKEKVSSYEELAGKGIKYNFEGKVVLVGNNSLVEKEKEKSDSTKKIKNNTKALIIKQ